MDMASAIHMPGPVCLIENTKGQLVANQEALKTLSAITQPVVVVAIVGLYRTGKSYLMNKLAGKKNGFSLGSTVQYHTKGIWMWCVPHLYKPDNILVLLDTEGLGDVEKGDNQNDSWIFALAILLSSTFVYNSVGTINQQAMDQLHYVTELTDQIRAKSSPDVNEGDDSVEFVSFFPDFVWTLRDVTLKLEVDGQPLTPDEYLENSLKLKQGNREKDKNYNLPRLCIRKFFPKKKCFVFYPPTEWRKLGQLETLQDDELDSDFVQQVAEFCCYTFIHSKTKTLPGGLKVNGPRLQSLVLTYVSAINSGDLPCMENALLALAQRENSAAVQKAIAHYNQQMEKVQLPTETLQELLDLHRASEREAIEMFIRSSFKDVDHLFQMELACQLEKRWKDFCKQNQEASSDRCQALIQRIFSPLEEDVSQGIYSKPGGYHLFIQKTQKLKEKYLEEPRKGTQAEEVLGTYFSSKQSMINAILKTDEALTNKEREIEVERRKAESARAIAKKLEEMQKINEQMMERKEKSYQDHMKQLTEKMERDRAQLLEEQERTVALKLQEQVQLLKEGFQEESRRLQEEIKNVENRYKETMNLMKAQSAESTAKIENMQRKYEQMMEQKEKNHQENVTRLAEQLERDRANIMAEQERTLTRKLQEQERHLEDEIREERRKHQKEIQDMEMRNIEMNLSLKQAKHKAKILEEDQREFERMMERKQNSHQEHVRQLTEMMKRDTAQWVAEHKRSTARKLEVSNCVISIFSSNDQGSKPLITS
nr:guanylate-binding protein 1-like [Microcebus murinus]